MQYYSNSRKGIVKTFLRWKLSSLASIATANVYRSCLWVAYRVWNCFRQRSWHALLIVILDLSHPFYFCEQRVSCFISSPSPLQNSKFTFHVNLFKKEKFSTIALMYNNHSMILFNPLFPQWNCDTPVLTALAQSLEKSAIVSINTYYYKNMH